MVIVLAHSERNSPRSFPLRFYPLIEFAHRPREEETPRIDWRSFVPPPEFQGIMIADGTKDRGNVRIDGALPFARNNKSGWLPGSSEEGPARGARSHLVGGRERAGERSRIPRAGD